MEIAGKISQHNVFHLWNIEENSGNVQCALYQLAESEKILSHFLMHTVIYVFSGNS